VFDLFPNLKELLIWIQLHNSLDPSSVNYMLATKSLMYVSISVLYWDDEGSPLPPHIYLETFLF
jgi:hypothetical protein